tara:strand:- start:9371 stop:9796 length:426 start_codon:yes stop_codon:yes gene_type:complete
MILNNKKKIIFFIFSIFCFGFYLHIIGEGYILTVAHSMLEVGTVDNGTFVINKGGSKAISCADFHKKFPELLEYGNVVTPPKALGDGSGLFERFAKIDKSIIDTSNLGWREKMGVSLGSPEPKCIRSLGSFIDAVQSGTSK